MQRIRESATDVDAIRDVRGLGLMIGVELSFEGRDVVALMREKGILSNVTADTVIRIVPPLVISDEDLDRVAGRDKRLGGHREVALGSALGADVDATSRGDHGVSFGVGPGKQLGFRSTQVEERDPRRLFDTGDHLRNLVDGGLDVPGVEGLLAIPGFAQTPAGENERIIAFDDLYFLGAECPVRR